MKIELVAFSRKKAVEEAVSLYRSGFQYFIIHEGRKTLGYGYLLGSGEINYQRVIGLPSGNFVYLVDVLAGLSDNEKRLLSLNDYDLAARKADVFQKEESVAKVLCECRATCKQGIKDSEEMLYAFSGLITNGKALLSQKVVA